MSKLIDKNGKIQINMIYKLGLPEHQRTAEMYFWGV